MAFKRRAEPTTVEDERAALRAQHAALEDLKRQLTERVEAVRERELELHHALAEADSLPPAQTCHERCRRAVHRSHSVASRRSPSASGRVAAARGAQLAARERELELDPASAETMVGVRRP